MKTVRDICEFIEQSLDSGPVTVIETGCAYVCNPGDEAHTTTNNLYEFICREHEADLYSFDIDREHLDFAMKFISPLRKGKARVTFVQGDSVDGLLHQAGLWKLSGKYDKVDVLCLDSKEFDEDHMVNEFNAIKYYLKEKHFVLVDDIHNTNSVKYKKMVPILKELGYSWLEVHTPTGMFVAAKGYKLK